MAIVSVEKHTEIMECKLKEHLSEEEIRKYWRKLNRMNKKEIEDEWVSSYITRDI